ncbi:hypothetical protein C5167_041976, partial [Papaver somniferum]
IVTALTKQALSLKTCAPATAKTSPAKVSCYSNLNLHIIQFLPFLNSHIQTRQNLHTSTMFHCLRSKYYQANSSFVIPTSQDTYFSIANNTYQGLSSCDSLIDENIYNVTSLLPGYELRVPLRCACPTSNQILNGTKYLLTYSIMHLHNIS